MGFFENLGKIVNTVEKVGNSAMKAVEQRQAQIDYIQKTKFSRKTKDELVDVWRKHRNGTHILQGDEALAYKQECKKRGLIN